MGVTMIEVTKYHLVNKGNTVAYVDFQIPKWGLFLNDCRLMRAKSGHCFIAFPSKKVEKDGETNYYPYYCFEKDMSSRFQKAALNAVEEYAKEKAKEQAQQPQSEENECPF
jgi:DNA-binding cell septation regulator SpoVG